MSYKPLTPSYIHPCSVIKLTKLFRVVVILLFYMFIQITLIQSAYYTTQRSNIL